jgi:hypothetical protein
MFYVQLHLNPSLKDNSGIFGPYASREEAVEALKKDDWKEHPGIKYLYKDATEYHNGQWATIKPFEKFFHEIQRTTKKPAA